MRSRAAVWLFALAFSTPALSASPESEARVTAITDKLRCVVCQNQSVADSDAPLAVDLRSQVREQVAQGMTEEQVIAFMVERYGDFVLYRPPLKPSTLLLWFGPVLLLAAGVIALLRRISRQGAAASIDAQAARRAADLLANGEGT